MFIIVGLGNPGLKYEGTRHNVGFDVIDKIAEEYHIAVDTRKHRALIGRGVMDGFRVILAKPQTFMNLSGESIRELVDYYKVDEETDLIVIYEISAWMWDSSGSAKKEAPADIMVSRASSPIWDMTRFCDQDRSRRKAKGLRSGGLCAGTF